MIWGPSWDSTAPVWQERIVDLSAYDGMAEVEIVFSMHATTVVAYAGWYIDDVTISSSEGMGDNRATYGIPKL